MPSPFENIVIGNFLYGLGLAMGHQPQVVEGCISLLQQTPLDRPLGDVLVHYPGAVCLLEFKREEANWTKERAKLQMLRAVLKNRPHLESVSRDIHRFVRIDRFSTATATGEVPIIVSPYLDFDGDAPPEAPLAEFTRELVREAAGRMRHTQRRLHRYIHAVATFAHVRGLRAPGVLVSVSATGGLRYVAVDNIADLRCTGRTLLTRLHERERTRQQELAQQLQRAIEPPKRIQQRLIERERTLGHSR